MARVTVEDCIELVPNRFNLVLLAAQRSREIARGSVLQVDRDNDKNPVVALREIAESKISLDHLQHGIIQGLQKVSEPEEAEEEIRLAISEETDWIKDTQSSESMSEMVAEGFSFDDETEILDA